MKEKLAISIVIPAYNEAKRLPSYLERVIAYCDSTGKPCEIIMVDDGSSDETVESVLPYKARFGRLKIIRLKKNRGKGYAVKRGLMESSGDICAFVDADGSVLPDEIEKNLHYLLKDGYDIFAGSRVLTSESQVLVGKWYRKLIGKVFNFFVRSFLFKKIEDTQCGFKMFKKEVIVPLFSRSYLHRFGFDMEILYLAHKMGYKVKEGPVSWYHVDGSKVNLVTDSARMFINILQIRNWHCTPINVYSKYMGPDEYRYMYEMENYHWWFISRRRLVLQLIKSLQMKSPRILDVGVGTGGNLVEFSKMGEAFGVDISQQAIDFCRKRGLTNVVQCPAEKIEYPDKSFDIITCLDILEHVENPAVVLAELKRVLKDNGKIVITAAAFRLLWSQHDDALCHLRRYQKDSLSCDAREAGLKIKKMGYFFFTSFFVVAPMRILRRLFKSNYKLISDATTLPPKFLNQFLKVLFRLELKLMGSAGAPLGTTIYAILSK